MVKVETLLQGQMTRVSYKGWDEFHLSACTCERVSMTTYHLVMPAEPFVLFREHDNGHVQGYVCRLSPLVVVTFSFLEGGTYF